jgi:hypothetical protein
VLLETRFCGGTSNGECGGLKHTYAKKAFDCALIQLLASVLVAIPYQVVVVNGTGGDHRRRSIFVQLK